MPIKSADGRAFLWGIALWIIGFAWGMIVFATPELRRIPSIPFVSKYPVISGALLAVYVVLLMFISKRKVGAKSGVEIMRFGGIMLVVNFGLDFIVYYVLFGSSDYFSYLSIWVAYFLFLAVPWFADPGRKLRD